MSIEVEIVSSGIDKPLNDLKKLEQQAKKMGSTIERSSKKMELPSLDQRGNQRFQALESGAMALVNPLRKVTKHLNDVEAAAIRAEDAARFVGASGGGGGMMPGGRRVGAASAAAKKDNRGFAVLAISQGVEDFSMAGMRGILNNIPQMLMFSGVSAGMTGAISLLAVAATVAVPHMLDYAKVMKQVEESGRGAELMKAALNSLKDALFDLDLSEWAKNQAKDFDREMESMAEAFAAPRKALEDFEKAQGKAASHAKEMQALADRKDALTNPRYSQDSAMLSAAQEAKDTQAEIAALKERQLKATRQMAKLDATRSASEIFSNPRERADFISASEFRGEFTEKQGTSDFAASRVAQAELEMESLKKESGSFAQTVGKMLDATPTAQASGFSLAKDWEQRLIQKKREVDAIKEEKRIADQQLETLKAKKQLQDDSVAKYDQGIKKAREESDLLKKRVEEAGDELRKKEEVLRVQNEIHKETARKAMGDELARLNEYANATRIDPGTMLSSQARAGMSMNETKNALGVINLQRQANKWLEQIASNTRKQFTATWGE